MLKRRGFDAYLAKIEHISMVMCYLTAELNHRGWIANGTKLQSVKSSFWNFGGVKFSQPQTSEV